MPPWLYFWLAVLSEIGVLLILSTDPDGWQLHDLLSWQPHHELWEIVLAVLSAAFYFGYWRASKKATT